MKEEFFGRNELKEVVVEGLFGLKDKQQQVVLVPYGENRGWYENGQIEHQGRFSNEGKVKVGDWSYWFENGKLKAEEHYLNEDDTDSGVNIKIGEWKNWYGNGQLKVSSAFDQQGKLHGLKTLYCQNGAVAAKGEFNHGAKIGEHRLWDCSGNELGLDTYADGKRHGVFNMFHVKSSNAYMTVNVSSLSTIRPDQHNASLFYKQIEGQYQNGKKIGIWTEWNKDGHVVKVTDYNQSNFIDPEYQNIFLEKGGFGPYARHSKYWSGFANSFDFIHVKPDVAAVKLYLDRGLVDPAKKINTGRSMTSYGMTEWSYPIIAAPESLFDLIKSYPGVDIKARDSKGRNRLHVCAKLLFENKKGRCSIEHFNFLAKNMPVNIEDADGLTALDIVIENAHKDRSSWRKKSYSESRAISMLKELVRQGADINHRNPEGLTPLMIALGERQFVLAKTLIELGADVSLQDPDGFNAIRYVFVERNGRRYVTGIDENRKDILKALVSKGLSIDSPVLKGMTAKDIALKNGAVETLRFLEKLPVLAASTESDNNAAALGGASQIGQNSSIEKEENAQQILKEALPSRPKADSHQEPVATDASDSTFVQPVVDEGQTIYETTLSYIKRNRLSKPKGDCAIDKMNELSALTSASDPKVIDLRDKISSQYLELARSRINNYRYNEARTFINQSKKVHPSKKASAMLAELDNILAQEKAFQAKAYESSQQRYSKKQASQARDNINAIGDLFKSLLD